VNPTVGDQPAAEQPIERSWSDVVEGAEHRDAVDRLTIETDGTMGTCCMTAELVEVVGTTAQSRRLVRVEPLGSDMRAEVPRGPEGVSWGTVELRGV
jgi:hypothetical protein